MAERGAGSRDWPDRDKNDQIQRHCAEKAMITREWVRHKLRHGGLIEWRVSGVGFYLLKLTGVVYSGGRAKDEGQKRISGKGTSAMVIEPVSGLLVLLPWSINRLIMCRRQSQTGQRAPPRHWVSCISLEVFVFFVFFCTPLTHRLYKRGQ